MIFLYLYFPVANVWINKLLAENIWKLLIQKQKMRSEKQIKAFAGT